MSLPAEVTVGALRWNVREHEGLVVFTEAYGLALGAFSARISFERERSSGSWEVSIQGHNQMARVGHLIGLYRVVEREYG